MKIVADEHIPLLKGVLEPYAEIVYAPANILHAALVKDADALLIRTRTRCNQSLLATAAVRFIGTATVGADHIDEAYCRQNGIAVCTAAGSNARAVMQYVIAALCAIAGKTGKKLPDCTLGIIGGGNVGRVVQAAAAAMGMRTLLNDPPRALREGASGFTAIDRLLADADIITLHVPLTDTTRRLASDAFFEQMKHGAALINTSRGDVVNETALLRYRQKLSAVVLDVWHNEPHINTTVLNAATIATPHIAGYSVQGKRNATTMMVQSLARFFDIAPLKHFEAAGAENQPVIDLSDNLPARILEKYPIFEDDKLLRQQPQNFEQLRNHYTLRNEFQLFCLPL